MCNVQPSQIIFIDREAREIIRLVASVCPSVHLHSAFRCHNKRRIGDVQAANPSYDMTKVFKDVLLRQVTQIKLSVGCIYFNIHLAK